MAMGQGKLSGLLDSLDTLTHDRQLASLQHLYNRWPSTKTKDTTYIRLVVNLARAFDKTGQTASSISLLKHLIWQVHRRQVISSPASDQLLKAYYRLMFCQQQHGRMAEAHQTGKQGLTLARQYPRSKWASNLYTTLAYVCSTEGDYEQATSLAERGAAIALVVGDTYCIGNGFFEQAKALRALERVGEAHRAIDQAIAVGRQPPMLDDLSLYYSIKASLLQREKRFADTEYWFQQAIALNQSRKDTATLASNYTDLGYFYTETGQYASAIRILRTAVRLQPVSSVRAVALDNLGVAYQKTGRTTQALQTLQRAISELIPAYKPHQLTEWPDSKLTRSAPNKEFLLGILQNIAENWLQQGINRQSPQALTNALHTFTLADQLVDYMRWEHTGHQSKLYWRHKTRPLYEGAIETCFRLNNQVMAYRFIEKSRAVMLTDKLNELGARRLLSPQLAEQEQSLSRNVSALRLKLATEKPGTTAYDRMQANLLIEQEKSDAFVREMEKTNPLYYRYRYDNAIRPLAEVCQWLTTRNQSLVSYFVGDSAVYVLGVSPVGPRLLRQSLPDYTKGLHAWLTLLNDPAALNSQQAQFTKTGFSLYQLLLSPLHLPEGRVMVSPDGFFLPFEALSRSATTPDYLVNRFAFSYVYSVNRMLTDPHGMNTDGGFVGMAPEQFAGTRLPALPGSGESLKRVGGHFFWPTLLTGPTATRSKFRELAPRASVVQLFTHADADTLQREPVIYFADTLLSLSELQTGPVFQTQLLVLSACRTGVGSHQKGEGVFSLARGFAALGVSSMLTTLWSVDSGPTYTLTELFYAGLADGLDKDIALQRAKQEWLRSPSRSHQLANTWAGLILIGDSQPLRQSGLTLAGAVAWIGGGLLGILGIGWFMRRRREKVGKAFSTQSGNWKPSLN